MKSAAEMGLEVVDMPVASIEAAENGSLIDSVRRDCGPEECPRCGRVAVLFGFDAYVGDQCVGFFHKVLCGWCGWVAV